MCQLYHIRIYNQGLNSARSKIRHLHLEIWHLCLEIQHLKYEIQHLVIEIQHHLLEIYQLVHCKISMIIYSDLTDSDLMQTAVCTCGGDIKNVQLFVHLHTDKQSLV